MDSFFSSARLIVVTLGVGLLVAAAPRPADAALRLGVDGHWMPAATSKLESDSAAVGGNHEIDSFGASVHGNLGFNVFSVGLKLNYFNEAFKLKADNVTSMVRRRQLDVNGMLRVGVPSTKLGIIGEGGLTVSPDFNGIGYNITAGAEYSIVSLKVLHLSLGAEGQYAKLS